MKTEEFRVGNLCNYHGQTVHVMDIRTSGINSPSISFGYFIDSVGFERMISHEDCPSPIPLAKNWLEEFGFELFGKDDSPSPSDWYWIKRNFHLSLSNPAFRIHPCNIRIRYVHQLQNLYFALTGEELTWKK